MVCKVLIVDDDKDLRDLTQEVLEYSLPDVEAFSSSKGEEALEIFNKNPDISIVTLNSLRENTVTGVDLARELRKLNPYLVLIAVSGEKTTSELRELMEIGIDAYLRKPYSNDELLWTINNAINRVHKIRELNTKEISRYETTVAKTLDIVGKANAIFEELNNGNRKNRRNAWTATEFIRSIFKKSKSSSEIVGNNATTG